MFPAMKIFGVSVYAYSFFMLVGFIALLATALLLRPKAFPAKYVFWGVIITYASALIGTSILGVLTNAIAHPEWGFKRIILTSGLAYLGAPIFGLAAMWIYCRLIKVPFLAVADYAAPLLMLERVFGRLGCLLSGCCYGVRSDLPWAYPFLYERPAHPTQAYELAIALAILISSAYLYRKTADTRLTRPPADLANTGIEELRRLLRETPSTGVVFFYVLLAYSFLRSFNEFLRAEGPFLYGPLKASHLILAVIAILSFAGLSSAIKRSSRKEEMLKALKGSFIRLLIWLVIWLVVILAPIAIYSRNYISTTKYVPNTTVVIPEVKQSLGIPKF